MDLKDYLRIIRRRWVEAGLTALLVLFFQLFWVQYRRVSLYESSVEFVVKQHPAEIGIFWEDAFQPLLTPFRTRVARLTGQRVAEAAHRICTHVPAEAFRSLRVVTDEEQRLVVVHAVTSDPEVAQQMAAAAVEAFALVDAEETSEARSRALHFLEGQREAVEEGARAARRELQGFVEENLLWAPDQQAALRFGRISALEQMIYQLDLEERRIEAGLTIGAGSPLGPFLMGGQQATSPSDSTAKMVTGRIGELRVALQDALSRYTDQHPKVRALQSEIGYWEEILEQSRTGERDPERAWVEALRAQRKVIQAELDREWGEIRKHVAHQERLDQLRDERNRWNQELTDISRRQQELSLLMAGVEDTVEVIRGPTSAYSKVASWNESLPFALVVAILMGVTVGYLREYLSNTIRGAHDCRIYLNLPAVATIPLFRDVEVDLLRVATKSPMAEIFYRLATFLESYALEHRARTFLFTSSRPAEGKSTVAANLSIALAMGGEQVILVDSDLRKPSQHIRFGLDNSLGLSTLLSGEAEVEIALKRLGAQGPARTLADYLQPTAVPTLRVLPAGPVPPNPVALLKSDRLAELMESLQRECTMLTFDSPPLIGVVDGAILAGVCDATFLILADGEVTRREGVQIKHSLSQVGAVVGGAIVNKGVFEPQEYHYYAYYHRYRSTYPR